MEVVMDQPSLMSTATLAAALSAVIDRTSASMVRAGIGAAEAAPWLFTRCVLFTLRYENGGREPADFGHALADFDALPGDFPSRAKLAAILVTAQLPEAVKGRGEDFARSLALAEVADGDRDPLPGWPQTYAVLRAHSLVIAAMSRAPGFQSRAALAEVERYAQLVGGQAPHAQMIEVSRLALGYLVAVLDNDLPAVERYIAQTVALRDRQPPGTTARTQLDGAALMAQAFLAMIRKDRGAIRETLAAAEKMVGPLPSDDALRQQFEQLRRAAEPLLGDS
jgi:hypothetical protein